MTTKRPDGDAAGEDGEERQPTAPASLRELVTALLAPATRASAKRVKEQRRRAAAALHMLQRALAKLRAIPAGLQEPPDLDLEADGIGALRRFRRRGESLILPEGTYAATSQEGALFEAAAGWSEMASDSELARFVEDSLSSSSASGLKHALFDALASLSAADLEAIGRQVLGRPVVYSPVVLRRPPLPPPPRVDHVALAEAGLAGLIEVLAVRMAEAVARHPERDLALSDAMMEARNGLVLAVERYDLPGVSGQGATLAALAAQRSVSAAAAADTDASLVLSALAVVAAPEDQPDVRALAWASRGNAYRVLGEMAAGDEAFSRAEQLVADAPLEAPERPRVYSLLASWHADRRRFAEALRLLDEARDLDSAGDGLLVTRLRTKKGRTLLMKGDAAEAAQELAKVYDLVVVREGGADRRQSWAATFNLAVAYTEIGGEHAERMLREAARFADTRPDQLRVRWAEARLLVARGRKPEAAEILGEVWPAFADVERPGEASVCALELAVILAELGELAEVRSLVVGLGPVLQARALGREALAALALAATSVLAERHAGTLAGILDQVAQFLRVALDNPRARFELPEMAPDYLKRAVRDALKSRRPE